jgi:hypothetical protein
VDENIKIWTVHSWKQLHTIIFSLVKNVLLLGNPSTYVWCCCTLVIKF